MKGHHVLGLAVAIALGLSTAPLAAQPTTSDQPADQTPAAANQQTATQAETIDEPHTQAPPAPPERHTLLPIGLGLSVGGGFAGFLSSDFNDIVNPGGGWNARLLVGTDHMIGAEFGYVGTANDLQELGLDENAYLLTNGGHVAVRLSLLPMYYDFRPYLLAGAGWKHYSVQRTRQNSSSLNSSDDVLEIPLAGGIHYDYAPLFADLRVTFAPAFGEGLVKGPLDNHGDLSTWATDANVGFEF